MGVASRHEYQHGGKRRTPGTESTSANLPVAEAPREPEITRMTGIVKSGDTPSTLAGRVHGPAGDLQPLQRKQAMSIP